MTVASPYWSIKVGAPGTIVAGADDIEQSIRMIVGTQRGSVPLMPQFGVDRTILDRPINIAAPLFIADVVSAIEEWETRCIIEDATYALTESGMLLILTWNSPINPKALTTQVPITVRHAA